ncbi:MAG: DUF6160 family protein [Pseudomonadota bacterium]|nr:DUF6160 family protein [Pseudomonadota bacterium]
MKLFPQLALVSAIAISGNAMAMQALDDEALSAATGQDGITIQITPPGTGITIDSIVVHDSDGDAVNAGGDAGAIVLGDNLNGNAGNQFSIDTAGDAIEVVIDADGNGGAPVLNVAINLPAALTITTGDISVAASTGVGNAVTAGVVVIDSFDIALGGASLNVQLGNEAQGAMIVASGSIAGGLTITDFSLNDTDDQGGTGISGGGIHLGSINVRDAGGANLTLGATIDASAAGLVITANSGVDSDITLTNVRLGLDTNAAIGDVELLGMSTNGTQITISGH